ncbi:unnamed protein product [Fraxinus pennsylvanica]|uniref:Uncharacterized protein n=1 Tax=Fraxinus pennsylvanica TaxID=56036 RepID=A0AAD1YXP2_9LAMI|nr:unnamed protein product [Fraxinus pennsylvanica]
MAAASLSLLRLQPPSISHSTNTHHFFQIPHHIPILPHCKTPKFKLLKKISFALAESSDSPNSLDSEVQILLKELSDVFVLPADYFSQLPRDLRLDMNDAAFDLSNGPVKDECGEDLGQTLLNISRAWERADTATSATLVSKLPLLVRTLTDSNKSALGKRLISAGRRFQSMGQYGRGELQMIAKVMIRTGNLLSSSPVSETANEEPKPESRMLKFGELQVELTSEKAYIGAFIGFVFGISVTLDLSTMG